MYRFLKRVSIFSGIILLLTVVVEYTLRQIPNIYTFKQELVDTKGMEMKNIILGSSVVDCCINPELLADSTYNLAIPGQWYHYSLSFFEKNLYKMPNLKCIIFGICYHSFWCDDTMERDIRSYVSHRIYMGIGEFDNILSYSELLTSGSLSLRKWSKYYIRCKSTIHCTKFGLDNGYHSSKKKNDLSSEAIEDAVSQSVQIDESGNIQLFKENHQRLNRLADITFQKGIRLIFIIPPVHSIYLTNSNQRQWDLVRGTIYQLSNQWGHISFKDYSNSNDFYDEDFYDGNHLNSDIGGTKFSLMIKEDFDL